MRALFGLLLILLPIAAAAAPPVASPTPPLLCESAIANAEISGRIPARMMGAIAQVESGRTDPGTGQVHPWPWTINAAGEGAFFASKAQAIAAVQMLQAQGIRSIDVGCMQVNLMFHPNAFATLDAAFDPNTNTAYAARFLNVLFDQKRNWPAAIAAYHSETQILGAAYQQRVLARWQSPGTALATSPYAAFSPQQSMYRDFTPSSRAYRDFVTAP
jgi:hypothetical protein